MNKSRKKNRFKNLVASTIPALVVVHAGTRTAPADEVQSVAANAIAQASTTRPRPPPPELEPFTVIKGVRR